MKKCILLLNALFLLLCTQGAHAERLEATAVGLADYLAAGRSVIADNQALINDPSMGDKGFSPEVYEEQVRRKLMRRSGIDIRTLDSDDDFGGAMTAIHESAKEVVAGAQPLINEPGRGFKGFIPAVFGRKVGDRFYRRSGITIKQTSLRFRNEYNKPDDFEVRVLKELKDAEKGNTYYKEIMFGDLRVLRYVVPLYIEKSCLPCHGEPAGEKDITGRIKEGYKEGEMRGAISVIAPIRCELDSN